MNSTLPPFLIAGLGNPGREYRNNRHNAGFMLVDRLAARLGFTFARLESKALIAKGDFQGRRVILAKPQTYMNLSGQAIGGLLRFYKIPIDNLLVVHDDVDLPFGTLRLRPDGGSGGQKGVKSILEQLGNADFARLRIGLNRPPGRMEAASYVLDDFSNSESEQLAEILERGVEAVLTYITGGLQTAMNQFNATSNT